MKSDEFTPGGISIVRNDPVAKALRKVADRVETKISSGRNIVSESLVYILREVAEEIEKETK